jgi:beta-glucosidase
VTAVLGFCGNSTSALVSNYVGQYCPGGGSACFPSLLASISALGEAAAFSPGCSSPTACSPADIAAAAALAGHPATTRIVLCLGIGQGQEAEQKDRVNVTLPEQQQALFAAVSAAAASAARPLAVVLVHGGALSVAEVAASPGVGILDAFYPGPEGGAALADALFGAYNPGGKLPYTVYSAGYTAAVDMADMRIAEVGRTYRYLSPTLCPGGPPIWRFGYGLSYTTFSLAYSGAPTLLLTPAAPQLQLPVLLTNTGAVAGDEVLQVYLVPLPGTLAPPLPPYLPQRSLVGFERVRLGPGESRLLTATLAAYGCNLTLSDGTQRPVSGSYKVLLSRGQGVGEELEVPLTLQGWY